MNSVTPVKLTLNGVERELRFTLGAKKMIVDLLGLQFREALNKYDTGCFPEVLFALMHDEEGKPPSVTLSWLKNNLPVDEDLSAQFLGAILSAASQGKASKNELEALAKKVMEVNRQELLKMIGYTSSASERSASDSAEPNSGGDTSSAKSPQESTDTAS